ncbi:hypothetical protein BDV95DRAFT_671224 [Massariosphaeria phaeospora]|uniref:DUF6536 domain-containing protein n=1 Tax=Massariosphaeria phaeospora TaxID=100035 RepID=A0A7C8I0K9_9PLEO|nr:hypothetical protein BDV95DRAFT_671224 [Massariosphaeria phaeospora]
MSKTAHESTSFISATSSALAPHPSPTRVNWKSGSLACATAALSVFLLNLTIIIWGEKRNGFPSLSKADEKRVLYDGDCTTTKRLNIAAHLLINVFSTVLLGASNYCMQCMSAPTRAEVDRAHKRGRYNSTIFSSLGAQMYDIFSANEAFAHDPLAKINLVSGSLEYNYNTSESLLGPVNMTQLERLDINECIAAYAQNYQTARGNLFLVFPNGTTDFQDEQGSLVHFEAQDVPMSALFEFGPFKWMCLNSRCTVGGSRASCEASIPCITASPREWAPFKKEIAYCLSEKIPEHCQLGYSIHLALAVLFMSLTKTALMLYIALRFRERPLLTVGDAIASFLKRPDVFTQRGCLVGRTDAQQLFDSSGVVRQPKRYVSKPVRRVHAASATRTGVLEVSTLIRWWLPESLIVNVAVANSPQLVFSFLYLTYNGLATTMSLASEWSAYAHTRKGLRVSINPQRRQRSTYFLQLPPRLGIPLMVMSGTMHWLISQSLFLVSVNVYNPRDASRGTTPDEDNSYTTCGYSPTAILATITVGTVAFLCVVGLGGKKLKSGMPVAGSCSAAIAAACRPGVETESEGRDDAPLEMVKWGVMKDGYGDEVGHCGFSVEKVGVPVDGDFYE